MYECYRSRWRRWRRRRSVWRSRWVKWWVRTGDLLTRCKRQTTKLMNCDANLSAMRRTNNFLLSVNFCVVLVGDQFWLCIFTICWKFFLHAVFEGVFWHVDVVYRLDIVLIWFVTYASRILLHFIVVFWSFMSQPSVLPASFISDRFVVSGSLWMLGQLKPSCKHLWHLVLYRLL